VAYAAHPPLIDLGGVRLDVPTVRRGGLDSGEVRAALAAQGRHVQQEVAVAGSGSSF
jgi:hypothetical protein